MKKVKEYLESIKPQFNVLEYKAGSIHQVQRIKDGQKFNVGRDIPFYYRHITKDEAPGLTAAVSISQHISLFMDDLITVYLVTEVHLAYFKNQEDRDWLRNMKLLKYITSTSLIPINDIDDELKKFRRDYFDRVLNNPDNINWLNNYKGELELHEES